MPTPVDVARQCLAHEAAEVLDEAMTVARRRGHAQTTSLHMLSSLLSAQDSCLRTACTKARSSAYSVRVQFKALEISLSVSLDRLPSSAKVEEPPVANSLMAAIKRSQSNQRRQPENFNFYLREQQISPSTSVAGTKVELPTLILSILDDPLVSRVFSEAGFRSCDIKMATLRPGFNFRTPHLFCYTSRYKHQSPHQFQCNLGFTEKGLQLGSKSFKFPFLGCFSWDENCRRIGEIMLRNKRRNPVLLGVYAPDALITFLDTLKSKPGSYLLVNLTGLRTVSLIDNNEFLNQKLEETESSLRNSAAASGVVINLGDFTVFIDERFSGDDLVGKLAGMIKNHGGRLWLIGTVSTYDVYFKLLNKFPSIEKEWDIEILPIITSIGGSYHKSSLMESFVPLGGFFSMPSASKRSFTSIGQNNPLNHVAVQVEDDPNRDVPRILGFEVTENDKESRSSSKENNKAVIVSSLTSDKQMSSSSPKLRLFDILSKPENDHRIDSASSASPSSVTYRYETHDPYLVHVDDHSLRSSSPSQCSSCCFMTKEPKDFYKSVVERVGDEQEDAVVAVMDAIKTGFHGRNRRGIWLHLQGPDRLAKRKLGLALAEMLYGNRESFIFVDLSFQDGPDSCFSPKEVKNMYEIDMRSTIVDYLVEKLSKKPCVVFLENIDKSDVVVRNSLFRAAKSSRLTDLHGREVSVSNSIFLATTTEFGQEQEDKYSEDEILKTCGGLIQVCIRFDLNDDPTSPKSKGFSDMLMNKRKIMSQCRNNARNGSSKISKRATNSHLDLNLPTDEVSCTSSLEDSNSSTSWIEDLDRIVDRVVVFKAVDFSSLAEKVFECMSVCLDEVVGTKCTLEIERRVMMQILAAHCLMGKERVEEWIHGVVCDGFGEAMERFSLSGQSIVKLVCLEENSSDESVGLLPGKLIVN